MINGAGAQGGSVPRTDHARSIGNLGFLRSEFYSFARIIGSDHMGIHPGV
jgi:hypothetical protein